MKPFHSTIDQSTEKSDIIAVATAASVTAQLKALVLSFFIILPGLYVGNNSIVAWTAISLIEVPAKRNNSKQERYGDSSSDTALNILYIVTSLSEYNTGDRATFRGSD